MRERGYGVSPSLTKAIITSSSVDGRAVRKGSVLQPCILETGANGRGGTQHAGTSLSNVSERSGHLQQVNFGRRMKARAWRCN